MLLSSRLLNLFEDICFTCTCHVHLVQKYKTLVPVSRCILGHMDDDYDDEIMDNVQENLYKVLVIGEYGVGKEPNYDLID